MVRKGNYEGMGILCCIKHNSEIDKSVHIAELKPIMKQFTDVFQEPKEATTS